MPERRRLKVWGGNAFLKRTTNLNGSTQTRTLVAARTKKRAVELLQSLERNMTMHHFSGYWSETGNAHELFVAIEEGVWVNQGAENAPQYERALCLTHSPPRERGRSHGIA